MKDGLRSDAINQFFEDRAGRLWIATSSGLTLWDGKTFRNYCIWRTGHDLRPRAGDRARMFGGDLLIGTDGGVLNRVRGDRIVADPLLAHVGRVKVTTDLRGSSPFHLARDKRRRS